MPTHYLCACKEINGAIYITRMSVASIGVPSGMSPPLPSDTGAEPGFAPSTDDGQWYFVGPGLRPSVQQYSGLTQFILTFDFLGHLTTRVVDIGAWPPAIVNPISQGTTGGPNTTALWTPNTIYLTGAQVIDFNHHVQRALAGGVSAPGGSISAVAIAANILTVTAPNTFTPGQHVACGGMMTATFLNGVEFTVATVIGAGPTYTGFTASTTSGTFPVTANLPASYGPAADAGRVAVVPAFSDVGGDVADNTVTWGDQGVAVAFFNNFGSSNDAVSLQLIGQNSGGKVDNFFNPPVIDRSLLFLNGFTNTFSVTVSLDPGWVPMLNPAGVTAYFRLYRRTFIPTPGPWVLLMDWSPNTFSYVDSHTAATPMQYQYSATWGDLWSPAAPNDPTMHAEGIPGGYIVTVNSAVEHPSYQFQLTDFVTLKEESTFSHMYAGARQSFVYMNAPTPPPDTIDFPLALVGNMSSGEMVGSRSTFLFVVAPQPPGTIDSIPAPFSDGPSNYYVSLSAPMQMYT
jgi:hypothetical protein